MKLLRLILCLFFLSAIINGADQPDFPDIYIDEGCAGTHVGSQANPYDDLSDINWTTGGDNSIFDYYNDTPTARVRVRLNRGDTWLEMLTIGASGSATYPILIHPYGSGAQPIIDGELTRNRCIFSNGKDYYTVDDLHLKDGIDGAWQMGNIEILNATDVIVSNCTIDHPKTSGVFLESSANCTIEDNLIETGSTNEENPVDGIYIQDGTGGHIIQRNTINIEIDADHANHSHIDGIQTNSEAGNLTIRHNKISSPVDYDTDIGNMHIYFEGGSGTYDVYYNEFYKLTDVQNIIVILGSATYNIYNNTFVNMAGPGDTTEGGGVEIRPGASTSSWTLRNNIFYIKNAFPFVSHPGINSVAQLNYNCYYRETGTSIFWDNTESPKGRTWAQLQTDGYEPNGVNADPLFVNLAGLDFHLQSGSPLVTTNHGVDVSLTPDLDGVTVPQGNYPEMGAYEYPANILRIREILRIRNVLRIK